MTDRPEHDELVSAAIDGEATAAEAAHVASDPVLQARRVALQAAAEVAGTPVEKSPAAARETAIAAALAVFDAGDAAATGDAVAAPVVSIASRRPARWLGIAAAALAAVAVGALLLRPGDGGTATTTVARQAASSSASEQKATSAEGGDAASSARPTAAAESQAGAATGTALDAAPTAPGTDLGTFTTVDELTLAVRSRLAAPPASTTVPAYGGLPTPISCPPPDTLASTSLVATATLAGRPVVVFVGPTAAGGNLVYLAVDATCTTVVTQDLSS